MFSCVERANALLSKAADREYEDKDRESIDDADKDAEVEYAEYEEWDVVFAIDAVVENGLFLMLMLNQRQKNLAHYYGKSHIMAHYNLYSPTILKWSM